MWREPPRLAYPQRKKPLWPTLTTLTRAEADACGRAPGGFHAVEWDHRTNGGQTLWAGAYLYRIQVGTFRDQLAVVSGLMV